MGTVTSSMHERNDALDPAQDWAAAELPDAWPDRATWRRPGTLFEIVRHVLGKRTKVRLPEGLPGAERIPRYVLQEFHGLPNGNYSNRLTHGYITGFEYSMLGELDRSRAVIAERMSGFESVLDLGCGGGKTGARVHAAGVPDVHGVDPSPYLLKHAATDHPALQLAQGTLESIPYPDARFDGVAVNFVFHEIPPYYLRCGLAEIARVLRPGGVLAVSEPSPLQARRSMGWLVRHYGWRGFYFRTLVRLVHEPFMDAWHRFDVPGEAAAVGLETESIAEGMPIKRWFLRRTA